MNDVPELTDLIRILNNDRSVWRKVTVLNGAEMKVIGCCNSERCQRVKVIGAPHVPRVMKRMDGPKPGQMPGEIEDILDLCMTHQGLKQQIAGYNTSRFDLVFECRGRGLEKWYIGDS